MKCIHMEGACNHVYVRGPKKGTVCGVRLRAQRNVEAGKCGIHREDVLLKSADQSKALASKEREIKTEVVIDNTTGIYKNAPRGEVKRVVGPARVRALKRAGVVKEPAVETTVEDENAKLRALVACLMKAQC